MNQTPSPGNLSDRTELAIREVVGGRRSGLGAALLFAGPAVIASIAYMDPGNFATNIQAGAKYGYALLWVALLANLIAMLFQGLSAKLGIVTGRNLAEMSRDQFPQPVVIALWIAVEIAAIATDLAEFVGGAIGLSLLFNIPLLAGMVVTGIVTYGVLLFEGGGFRPVELVIGGLVAAISLCYLAEMFIAPVDWDSAALHSVLPQIPDAAALTIAVGIIGATVMPHAIYLHSGLTQNRAAARDDDERRTLLRFSNVEVVLALAVAGLVNMAMIMMASAAFHQGHSDVAEIGDRLPLFGAAARRRRGDGVPRLAARLRRVELGGRHDGGPARHAGLRRLPHSAAGSAFGDDGPGVRGGGARRQRDQRARHQSSGVEHRAARADDLAGDVHPPPRHHGRFRQQPADRCGSPFSGPRSSWRSTSCCCCRRLASRSRACRRAERRSARSGRRKARPDRGLGGGDRGHVDDAARRH